MINYLYNPAATMLHDQTRHSNLHIPYERHVADHKFPDQIQELINTEVTLKYRNHNIVDINVTPEQYGRPMDDEDYYEREIGPDEYDQIDVYEEPFRVVRADNSEPFVLIGISKDYSKVLINSTRIVNGEYEFKHLISKLPKQDNSFFGLEVMDKYTKEPEFVEAVTIRTDDYEPCNSVMVEFLGSTNMIRLVTGDECISHIRDVKDDDYDFDARDSDEYDETPVDLDGLYASHEGITAMNIDGGHANNLRRLFFNRHVGDIAIEDLKQEELPEKDVDFGDMTSDDDLIDDGVFNFGNIFYEEPKAEGDYDMNDDSKEENYNFHSIDEEPPVEGQDDGKFNFGDDDETEPHAMGDYDMEQGNADYDFFDTDKDPIPEEYDDGKFNFDNTLEDEDDPCTTVGDYDMNSSAEENEYNFFNLEPEPLPDGAPYPEPGEDDDDGKYNFFDIDTDPPVIGPDDGENDYGDLNTIKPDNEYYYEGDEDHIECDFDFEELSEDEDAITYDYGDIDDPVYIIKPDLDSDFGELIDGVIPTDDGAFNFGEVEEPHAEGDYDMELGEENYDFYDINTDPPVVGEDDGRFNFIDDAPEEPEAEGDHDFGDISDKSYIYDDDDGTADFDDIEHPNQIDDDDLVYNFGDIDILPIPEDDKGIDDGQFNFGTIDWIEPYAHEDFDMNDDTVPSEDYDFFDIDEDDPVYGEDDGRFNFINGDEEATAEGDYDFNENLDDLYKKFIPDLYPEEKPKVIHIRDLTMAEIIDFRKMVFEGRNIYGSV